MSYEDAMRQIQKNIQLTKTKGDLMWNLNAGLTDVTKALSQDLADIQRSLRTISQILSRIEAKSQEKRPKPLEEDGLLVNLGHSSTKKELQGLGRISRRG